MKTKLILNVDGQSIERNYTFNDNEHFEMRDWDEEVMNMKDTLDSSEGAVDIFGISDKEEFTALEKTFY